MSDGILTNQGRNLFAQKQADGEPLTISSFVLAFIPDLVVDDPPNPDEQIPDDGLIVGQFPITSSAFVNQNSVVYSVFLNTEIGDFEFNWVGLVSEENTLVAVRYIQPITKFKTQGIKLGNSMTRNFLIVYTDAQAITQITVDASTWQLQFDLASVDTPGLVYKANQETVDLGSDSSRYVTPETLSGSTVRNLAYSEQGRALDASQGKVLADAILESSSTLSSKISAQDQSIGLLNSQISDTTGVATANQQSIALQSENIGLLTSTVGQNVSSITDHEERVGDLESFIDGWVGERKIIELVDAEYVLIAAMSYVQIGPVVFFHLNLFLNGNSGDNPILELVPDGGDIWPAKNNDLFRVHMSRQTGTATDYSTEWPPHEVIAALTSSSITLYTGANISFTSDRYVCNSFYMVEQ